MKRYWFRTARTAAAVATILMVTVLTGCMELFGPLENPVDPDADNYQGFDTVDDVNDIKANTATGLVWIVLTADEVIGADAYHLQLSATQDFTAPLRDTDGFTTNLMPVSSAVLVAGTTYHWRARARKNGAWGSWSPAATVTFSSASGMSPANATVTTPTVSWDAVSGAAGYEVQFADTEADVASATVNTVTNSEYTPASYLTNNTTHYWRVRAVDAEGQKTAWSSVLSLGVAWGGITGMSPSDGALTSENTPALSWAVVSGAVGYEVQVADTEADVPGSTIVEETVSSHAISDPLSTAGERRYWRVRAKDGDGQYGAWSGINYLERPYSVGDTGPAGGTVFHIDASAQFGWKYLEAWTTDEGAYQWKTNRTTTSGTSTAIGSGYANTYSAMAGAEHPAANVVRNASHGGYDDWFLPSKDELNLLYQNRVIVGAFSSGRYWSSSERTSISAWRQLFSNGGQNTNYKDSSYRIRVIRAF